MKAWSVGKRDQNSAKWREMRLQKAWGRDQLAGHKSLAVWPRVGHTRASLPGSGQKIHCDRRHMRRSVMAMTLPAPPTWSWFHSAGPGTTQLALAPTSWPWHHPAGPNTTQFALAPPSRPWHHPGCHDTTTRPWHHPGGPGTTQLALAPANRPWHHPGCHETTHQALAPPSWL